MTENLKDTIQPIPGGTISCPESIEGHTNDAPKGICFLSCLLKAATNIAVTDTEIFSAGTLPEEVQRERLARRARIYSLTVGCRLDHRCPLAANLQIDYAFPAGIPDDLPIFRERRRKI